jgi:hypothetical protein
MAFPAVFRPGTPKLMFVPFQDYPETWLSGGGAFSEVPEIAFRFSL